MHHPLGAFFEQHGEHRLTFSRLFYFADIRYFDGRNVVLLASNLALATLLALTFYRVTVRQTALSRSQRAGLAGAILLVTFSWKQNENFTWGFQNQWFAVYLFALCAFHAVDVCAEAQASGNLRRANGWLLTAIGSACVASYSMSSGVIVFPILLAQALFRRISLPRSGAVLVAGMFVFLAYFDNWHAAAGDGSLGTQLRDHPAGIIRYTLLYLGAPANNAAFQPVITYTFGIVVTLGLIVQCTRLTGRLCTTIKAPSLLALAVFVAMTALVTACGRLAIGLDSALVSRYTTASLACWLALAIFSALNACSERERRIVLIMSALAMVLLIAFQPTALNDDRELTYSRDIAGLALRAHVYDPTTTQAIYPFPDRLTVTAKAAEAAHLSLFSPDQTDYYVAPRHIVTGAACAGYIDSVSSTSTPGLIMATGWIYNAALHSVPRSIVITDTSGVTLGSGIAGGRRDDISQLFGSTARYSQWTVFAKAPPGTLIHAHGALAGNTFCTLAEAKQVTVGERQ